MIRPFCKMVGKCEQFATSWAKLRAHYRLRSSTEVRRAVKDMVDMELNGHRPHSIGVDPEKMTAHLIERLHRG
jgi:hypothetical protein